MYTSRGIRKRRSLRGSLKILGDIVSPIDESIQLHSPIGGPTPALRFVRSSLGLLQAVCDQRIAIERAADWFAGTIRKGRLVHVFGSGHSRIMVEEMWPRYGSFPGFHPIVELSLTFHNQVVGANGQRQAMFLENASGLAERILRNFDMKPVDTALVISSSGCNRVSIEMAEGFRKRKIKVVSIVSLAHAKAAKSNDPRGKKLMDFSDLVLDTGAPVGDAMVKIRGLEAPVSPGSTIGGCLLVNALKAEVADRLVKAGRPPKVLAAAAVVGASRSVAMFESAYDHYSRTMAKLHAGIGGKGRR